MRFGFAGTDRPAAGHGRPPREGPPVLERARGSLLGLAVGDALGATVEFMTPGEIRGKFGVHRRMVGGGWLRLRPGQVTDDTEMSLCIARAVVARGGWDLRAVAESFAAWLQGRPVDVGATCARGIRRFLHAGTLEGPPNEGDAGNGAAMRVAPVALLTLGDDEGLRSLAVAQARLTHHHPLSDAACVTVGRMIHAALRGASAHELHALAAGLEALHPGFAFRRGPGTCSPFVVDTLRTAFHAFFTTATFEECLVAAVNQGGDADTAGAIAGALSGAFYGMSAIPRRWVRRLDRTLREEVLALASSLVGLSPTARGVP